MQLIEEALRYYKIGFSIIPVKADKKPFLKSWTSYQKEIAKETEIREWWRKWPNANIAIITGLISGVTVIDADSEEAKDSIQQFLPESLVVPTVRSPKGWHFYFAYAPGLKTGARVLNKCDVRNDGGYIIAPPSTSANGSVYAWMEGSNLNNNIPEIPAILLDIFNMQCKNLHISSIVDLTSTLGDNGGIIRGEEGGKPGYDSCDSVTTLDDRLSQGSRDDNLFHLAHHLVKGDMPLNNIRYFLRFFASHCDPPFSERETEIKIKSALERQKKSYGNLTEEVREWVLSSSGVIFSSECPILSPLSSRNEKKAVSKVLSRLVEDKILERVGDRNGCFRRIDRNLNVIDLYNIKQDEISIKYPLDLQFLIKTQPKNIIIIAGTPNVGKTAFMMNLCTLNMNHGLEIRYFTSEMGGMELVERCKAFEPDVPFSFWKDVQFCDHSTGFKDKILPNGLNIIDYLEMSDTFYKIAEVLTGIYERLENGIAIIAIQKGFNQELGRGAEFSLEKPRLYITLSSNPPEGNIAKIVKGKNWRRGDINPNGMECIFHVIRGSIIKKVVDWYKP